MRVGVLCVGDHSRLTLRFPERAFIVASCNTFAYVFQVRRLSLVKWALTDHLRNSPGMAPDVSDGRKRSD